MKIIVDSYGEEIVFIENPDGTTLSMAKSTYDAQEAAKKLEATATLEAENN